MIDDLNIDSDSLCVAGGGSEFQAAQELGTNEKSRALVWANGWVNCSVEEDLSVEFLGTNTPAGKW